VAAFGIVAFGIFAVLFLRLWFLQVLQGDQYLRQATSNGERVIRIAAPRGTIVDRHRRAMVENRPTTVVALRADALPSEDRADIANWGHDQGQYDVALDRTADRIVAAAVARDEERARARTPAQRRRARRQRDRETPAQGRARTRRAALAVSRRRDAAERTAAVRLAVTGPPDPRALSVRRDASPELRRLLLRIGEPLGLTPATLYRRIVVSTVALPYGNVPLKARGVGDNLRVYLRERQRDFPELEVGTEFVRRYTHGALAGQLFGGVGEITPAQLTQAKYAGLEPGQVIGQDGLEYEYNSYLQGKDGLRRLEVDAQGDPTGRREERRPQQGSRLMLTIDTALERSGQRAMETTIGRSLDSKTGFRAAGAYVAIDPRNGEVLAMGSYPTIDLNRLRRPMSPRARRALLDDDAGVPLLNRAIQGQYATGSTFKTVSAFAALSSGFRTPESQDRGGDSRTIGGRPFFNAGRQDLGPADLRRSLEVSSDVYYYDVGQALFAHRDRPLQTWARLFGYSRPTGIDLPGEQPGVVPDADWRRTRNAQELACRKRQHQETCGLVFDPRGGFYAGDNVNLAIGQGDFLATPLQVAVAYAGLYDRPGRTTDELRFPTPQLGVQIQSSTGVQEQRFPPKPLRRVQIGEAGWKRAVLDGLEAVTRSPGGTASKVFAGWDHGRYPVQGKTGTAQRCGESRCPDQAWFAALVPDGERPIVVVATVENGNAGSSTAAPIVCRMLRTWYRQPASVAPCGKARGTAGDAARSRD
jgi:penicillin-binding protein 2